MYIDVALQKFIDYSIFIRGLSSTTMRGYKSSIEYFSRESNIDQVEEINERNVREFLLNGRVKKNWKSHTYVTYHKQFTVFVRWCIKENYLQGENFMDSIETPRHEKTLPKGLTKNQALKLIEIVHNYPYDYPFLRLRNHAIFAMFIYAGLRKKELLNLKLSDVDVENLTIFVRQGKGNKDRIIPMSYTLAHILKTYLKDRKRLNKTCPDFFTSLNRNMGFTTSGLKNLKRKIQYASQIEFTIHKLRHTFATLMIEGGCDIYSLSKMMGHSDISTTTIYLSASAEHLRGQMIKHPLNNL